ncbi:unnamed protein product [Eruca vesicaria subsp. sativa]|uniref:Uncharacterized protein n=1 Tax=Eruca vesicaria subsp. sativa TaxID=29727 RepID=A0ABC8IWV9_ERUVS|nr:unnamed protein product [Eruca vesicaria subsp. sativa]
MKKSKLENLLSPSSSWRENHNPPRRSPNSTAVSTGCLPGFFNLFLSTFNFSSNRRKSITLGSKKREERTVVYATPPEDTSNRDGRGIVEPPLTRNEGEGDAARVMAGDVVVGTQTNKNTKTTIEETDTDTTMFSTMKNDHEYKDNKTYKVNNINLITRPDHYDVISKRATIDTCCTSPLVVRKVRSQSLIDCVNQVSDDLASGQRREVAKIGLALHDHICRDLITEIVGELLFSQYEKNKCLKPEVDSADCYGKGSGRRHIRRGSTNSLPLEACRRRLVF